MFRLHEAFEYDHPEIAAILGRSPAAVRQTGHRAREHVQARRSRYQPSRGVQGRDKVARLLVAGITQYRPTDLTIRDAEVNGGPAALLFAGGEVFGVLVVEPSEHGDQVRAIYDVVNPDKLAWLAGALQEHP